MKKRGFLCLVLTFALCLCAFCGCGDKRNVKEELPGEWYVWHWYYNTKDGDNGFFDEARFYTFTADGKMTVKIGDTTSEATFKFVKDDTIDVVYGDGTTDTFQLIPSEHNGVDQIQMMNVDNIYTVTLEPMSTWKEN